MLFKACGIRRENDITDEQIELVDLFGINFSPLSRREVEKNELNAILKRIPKTKQVFVFKENSIQEMETILNKYKPNYVQIYNEYDLSIDYEIKKILAINITEQAQSKLAKDFESYEFLVLEGASSGAGELMSPNIKLDLIRYPFLLAGGINISNLNKAKKYRNCIGVDIASGIEYRKRVSRDKINGILEKLGKLKMVSNHG
jgi:phosphoribosylanthranilate isomerase